MNRKIRDFLLGMLVIILIFIPGIIFTEEYTFVDEVYGDTLTVRAVDSVEAIELLYSKRPDDSYLKQIHK